MGNQSVKTTKTKIDLLCFRTSSITFSCQYHIFEVPYQHQPATFLGKDAVREVRHRLQSTKPKFLSFTTEKKIRVVVTSCRNSNSLPSSLILYVRRTPVVHDLGARNVSRAVPTIRCRSPPRSANGTTATENAASLLVKWIGGRDSHYG